MNKEDINVAIAEACGWKNIRNNPAYPENQNKICGTYSKDDEALYAIPNYCEDLNACHAMEEVLTDEQYLLFRQKLNLTFKTPLNCRMESCTAPQRCEAFLKVLNLWKE